MLRLERECRGCTVRGYAGEGDQNPVSVYSESSLDMSAFFGGTRLQKVSDFTFCLDAFPGQAAGFSACNSFWENGSAVELDKEQRGA